MTRKVLKISEGKKSHYQNVAKNPKMDLHQTVEAPSEDAGASSSAGAPHEYANVPREPSSPHEYSVINDTAANHEYAPMNDPETGVTLNNEPSAETGNHEYIPLDDQPAAPVDSPTRATNFDYQPLTEGGSNGGVNSGDAEYSNIAAINSASGTSDADVILNVDRSKISEDELAELKERMHFDYEGKQLRIDYVLVYKDEPEKIDLVEMRQTFHQNLQDYDVVLYESPDVDISDPSLHYVLLHAPWNVLTNGAELLNLKKRLRMTDSLSKKLEDETETCCTTSCRTSQEFIPDEGDFFTAPFHRDRIEFFDTADQENFFTNAERSLIMREMLDRTCFTDENASEARFGVARLLQEGAYTAAYPVHEGPFKTPGGIVNQAAFEGKDKDRALLFETWAQFKRLCCYQPLDLIRKYFGEKIGLYFAWLGFYTQMLIPAAFLGLGACIYGLVTLFTDPVGNDICTDEDTSDIVMCPQCKVRCDYWELKESCIYSRITHVFDNYATIVFTFIMGVWGTLFLEFWKRRQSELQYEWDVQDYEDQERMRPEFEFKVNRKRPNPVTGYPEPYLTPASWFCRTFTSCGVVLFFVTMVMATILGIITYRFVIVFLLYTTDLDLVSTYAKIITSFTASIINLIVIMILGVVYKKVSFALTELECHKTETEFEDSHISKMFMFQFVNYYGTTFYIAFFKGKFRSHPGSDEYSFGRYEPDACDPSGCMIDLVIQLFIVMVGKQVFNQAKEVLIPFVCVKRKQIQAKKDEQEDGKVYTRWMQDRDMLQYNRLLLFEEYLEMVIQYGYVTIFVAAFPLAPLFALLNNITEIRVDAYKLLTQIQRPNALKAQDIGVWYGILRTMTYLSILTNAAIIAWTSDFIPHMVHVFVYSEDRSLDSFIEASLSVFSTSNFTSDSAPEKPDDVYSNITECRYKAYRNGPEHPTNPYGYSPQFWHVTVARLAFILLYEHACLLVTYIIAYMIPDVSNKVKRLKSYEKALNRHLSFKATFEEKKKKRREALQDFLPKL